MTNFSFLVNEKKTIPNICEPTAVPLQNNIKVNTDFAAFTSQFCHLLVVTLKNYLNSECLFLSSLFLFSYPLTATIKLFQDN